MIGKRIKQLREERGITQEELAIIIECSTAMIGLIETGKRVGSVQNLVKLAEYFFVSTDYLLGLTNEKRETLNVPQGYAVVLSEALDKKVSPDKLKKLIEVSKQLEDL